MIVSVSHCVQSFPFRSNARITLIISLSFRLLRAVHSDCVAGIRVKGRSNIWSGSQNSELTLSWCKFKYNIYRSGRMTVTVTPSGVLHQLPETLRPHKEKCLWKSWIAKVQSYTELRLEPASSMINRNRINEDWRQKLPQRAYSPLLWEFGPEINMPLINVHEGGRLAGHKRCNSTTIVRDAQRLKHWRLFWRTAFADLALFSAPSTSGDSNKSLPYANLYTQSQSNGSDVGLEDRPRLVTPPTYDDVAFNFT